MTKKRQLSLYKYNHSTNGKEARQKYRRTPKGRLNSNQIRKNGQVKFTKWMQAIKTFCLDSF